MQRNTPGLLDRRIGPKDMFIVLLYNKNKNNNNNDVICLAAVAMARERFVRVAPVLKAIKSVSTATQEGKVSVLTLRLDPQHLRHRRSRCSPSYRFHAHRLRRHNK